MWIGYVQAASSLSSETGLSLDKWDTCDNIDLYYILQDYEEYYQIKFGKPPKLIKQIQEGDYILYKLYYLRYSR